jgi:membrane-associated protein
VRPISYMIAGVVIIASIIAGIRAWRLDRAGRREADASA